MRRCKPAFFLPPSLAFAGTTDPRTTHTAAWSLPGGTSMVNSARAHRPICKRVGRGSSSYVHFERLLSPAQVERARRFAASPPVQQALSDAELFDGPGASRDRRSRVAWLDRAGHESDRLHVVSGKYASQ